MLDKTSAASVIEPATWIWSKWLKLQDQSQFKYRHFTHYEFIEDEMGRSEIQDNLAKLLYSYHSSSPINTNLLAQLKYCQLASVLTRSGDMRPHDTKTRSGNLVEILACEFAKKLGYDIPILRLQYNPNPEQSMKGDDILGFQFSERGGGRDAFLVGEGKFRGQFNRRAVIEAYEGLTRKTRSYPVSTEFTATILTLQGRQSTAVKIRQLSRKLAPQDKSVDRVNLLFLGTVGQPQNPFEYLEECGSDLLPGLMAVNIVFKNTFQNWINEVYSKEYWD